MLWEIVGGVAVVVTIATALCFWWWWPKWEVYRLRLEIYDAKDRADVEDNFRKTIGQLVGGAAVLIGAGLAYYQTQLTLQASHDQFINTLKASHDQLISQQVSQGFELLGQGGNEKTIKRLGGIYALEGVMKTSEQYRQPVLEALCAFVRDNTKTDIHGSPAADIQAVLTVIGRREAGSEELDLSNANLHDANMSHANMHGANLSYANMNHADLYNANLSGADLHGAYLIDADLSQADLTKTDLTGAHLHTAHLQRVGHLSGASLVSADLSNADLSKADLSGADLDDADLSHADLSHTVVAQTQLDKACGDEGTKLPLNRSLKPCH